MKVIKRQNLIGINRIKKNLILNNAWFGCMGSSSIKMETFPTKFAVNKSVSTSVSIRMLGCNFVTILFMRKSHLWWCFDHRNLEERSLKWWNSSLKCLVRSAQFFFCERILHDSLVPTIKYRSSSIVIWDWFTSAKTGDLVKFSEIIPKKF